MTSNQHSLEYLSRERLKFNLLAMASPSELATPIDEYPSPMTELVHTLSDGVHINSPSLTIDHRRRLSMDSISPSSTSTTPLSTITNLPKRHDNSNSNKIRPFLKFMNGSTTVSAGASTPDKENAIPSSAQSAPVKKGVLPKPFESNSDEDESSQDSGFFCSSSTSSAHPLFHKVTLLESLSRESVTSIRKTSADLRARADTEPLTILPEVDSPEKQISDGFNPDAEHFDLDEAPEYEEENDEELENKMTVVGTLIHNKVVLTSEYSNRPLHSASDIIKMPLRKPMLALRSTPEGQRLRRCMSMLNNDSYMESPVSRSSLSSFKRPNSPLNATSSSSADDDDSQVIKRRRFYHHSEKELHRNSNSRLTPKVKLNRSMSEITFSEVISVGLSTIDLTGDMTRPLLLPLMPLHVPHHDLKPISSETLSELINGKYKEDVESFRVIDARYAYEFVGGHIVNAENFGSWDEGSFFDEFLHQDKEALKVPLSGKRNILIFHCEFSSARGPELMKKLRQKDRWLNKESYPALYYPECYLLHKGYEDFFRHYPELCYPRGYRKMLDPEFKDEERTFHMKSKSWAGGTVARTASRSLRNPNT